jgi:hypothetical protein
VGFYELVHHHGYLVEGERARGVTVEHRRVIDVVPPPLQRRPDREVLDRRVRGASSRASCPPFRGARDLCRAELWWTRVARENSGCPSGASW